LQPSGGAVWLAFVTCYSHSVDISLLPTFVWSLVAVRWQLKARSRVWYHAGRVGLSPSRWPPRRWKMTSKIRTRLQIIKARAAKTEELTAVAHSYEANGHTSLERQATWPVC
jgi:hypothetical protein